MIARRGFRTSAARLSSPYHYPEGPRSNLPFNPLTKFFAVRYWGTMGEHEIDINDIESRLIGCTAFFFSLPFGVAGKIRMHISRLWN